MKAAPGGGLLHPIALASIVVLVLNDHVLKAQWGGWLTGKLSDFAGLVFFPLLLQGLWEVASSLLRRSAAPRREVLVAAGVLTAVVFALVKTWPPATSAWSQALGWLQWPYFAVTSVLHGRSWSAPRPVLSVTDPTDLMALPSIGLGVWLGWSRSSTS